jgi:tetratricopeptide (TPR) repeat protein
MKSITYLFLLIVLFIGFNANLAIGQDQAEYASKQQSFSIYQRALQAFQIGDFHSCTQLCRQAIDVDNQDKRFFHLEALSLSESGENDQALLAFRSALAIDFNFIQCRNNMGLFEMKLGKSEEAKATFQECIKIQPKYPDAHYHLAEILQKKGDLDAAIEEYETATRLNPNYFEAQRDLGLAIYEKASSGLTDIIDCEDKLKIAERLAPTNPMIHYHLGNIYCAGGKYDEAENQFKLALSFDSRLAGAHYELGRIRYFRGDPDRCLVEMNLASKISPTYTEDKKYPAIDIAQLKSFIAKCYEVKGNLAKAASFLSDVASMTKNNKDLLKRIKTLEKEGIDKRRQKAGCLESAVQGLLIKGITQTDSKEFDAAQSTFETMTTNYPNCFEGWQNHGALEEVLSNLQAAMKDYQKAIQLAPNYDGLYFNMAYLLEKMGLPAEAGGMYQQFHSLSGKFPYDSRHIVGLEQEYARQQAKMRVK